MEAAHLRKAGVTFPHGLVQLITLSNTVHGTHRRRSERNLPAAARPIHTSRHPS